MHQRHLIFEQRVTLFSLSALLSFGMLCLYMAGYAKLQTLVRLNVARCAHGEGRLYMARCVDRRLSVWLRHFMDLKSDSMLTNSGCTVCVSKIVHPDSGRQAGN